MEQEQIRRAVLSCTRPGLGEIVGRMRFDTVDRCWCGGRIEPWLPEFAVYWRCAECGCKSVRFRPTAESLSWLYSGHYWTDYQAIHNCPTIEERHENDLYDRVPQYLGWMRELRPPPARSLEIGCGNGRLLYEAARAGYQVSASEMDGRVAGWVRQKTGLPAFEGPFPPLSDGPYDLILALDVLEHVTDPVEFVREIQVRLRPGGKVLLHCPVIDSDDAAREWRDMFNPLSHLWMHTSQSLERLWAGVSMRPRRLGMLFGMPSLGLEE